LLSELPRAKGVGTDIAVSTLATARQNASRLGFASRASFVACNFVAALTGPFDLIVANPPYIRSSDIAELPVEVRDYDPRAALDGGPDGLAAYRAIASDMRRVLLPDGVAVLELGAGQEPAVAELLSQAGAKLITARPDLAGIARALIARF